MASPSQVRDSGRAATTRNSPGQQAVMVRCRCARPGPTCYPSLGRVARDPAGDADPSTITYRTREMFTPRAERTPADYAEATDWWRTPRSPRQAIRRDRSQAACRRYLAVALT